MPNSDLLWPIFFLSPEKHNLCSEAASGPTQAPTFVHEKCIFGTFFSMTLHFSKLFFFLSIYHVTDMLLAWMSLYECLYCTSCNQSADLNWTERTLTGYLMTCGLVYYLESKQKLLLLSLCLPDRWSHGGWAPSAACRSQTHTFIQNVLGCRFASCFYL